MSLEWGTIKRSILVVLCPINNAINIFMLYMIHNHSSKALSSYKKILYLGTIFDLFSANAAALSGMVIMVKYGYQFVLIQGIFGPLPEPFSGLAYSLYHLSQYIILAEVAVQFIYRLYLVYLDKPLGWTPVLIMIGVTFICSGANSYRRFSEFIRKHESSHDDMVKSFGWIDDKTGKVYDYAMFSTTTNNLPSYIIIGVSYFIIVVCALAVYVRVRIGVYQLQSFNATIHRQTTIVLCLEAIIPFFAVVLPSSIYFLSVVFNISVTWLDSVGTIFSFFDPLINALVKLIVIRCYRTTLLTWLRQTLPQNNQVSTTLQ
uniref:G protein-coupled receptor n=1 Tax=Panagrolaimus sp. JU765 TaxID=591449 RepID=A0AC34R0M7_9BILA